MDLVYPLIKWYNNNLELRYSLRSLTNLKYDNIYLLWYKPDWIKWIEHIEAEDNHYIKVVNVINKLKIVCEDDRISEDFILMNDDFYILKPTEIKYFNQWTISEHIDRRESNWVFHWVYAECLRYTNLMFPYWLDFELHIPIIYNKTRLKELFAKYEFNV